MTGEEAIRANHVSKTFGNYQALKEVTLSVPERQIFGFIGKNGAGKTTFMRILCGLMKPTGGAVEIRKRTSFLPQNVRLRDAMTVEETLRFFADLRKCGVAASLDFAGELELDAAANVGTLSPGQQRKLQLVAVTVGLPEVLILDEPTAGLDPTGVQQVRAVIQALRGNGCTVFLSSHVLMELENLCDAVAVIDKGEVLYRGECGTVYEIETDGLPENAVRKLAASFGKRFEAQGGLLTARVERGEIPSVLAWFYQNDVRVFGVRPRGMEALYNRLMKEAS